MFCHPWLLKADVLFCTFIPFKVVHNNIIHIHKCDIFCVSKSVLNFTLEMVVNGNATQDILLKTQNLHFIQFSNNSIMFLSLRILIKAAAQTVYVFKSMWGLLMDTVIHALVYKTSVMMGIELLQQFSQLCARAYYILQTLPPKFRRIPGLENISVSLVSILAKFQGRQFLDTNLECK